jgi:osmoprotectant transport system substrate-binding protein
MSRSIWPARRVGVALALALALLLAGCGEDGDGGIAGGDSSGGGDGVLAGASFTVGSKEFTEQLVLGQITVAVLDNAGAKVDDQTGLAGSVAARKALESGEIDMYWEYTGTNWLTYLKETKPLPDAQAQYEAVKKAEAANDIALLDPAPANNT